MALLNNIGTIIFTSYRYYTGITYFNLASNFSKVSFFFFLLPPLHIQIFVVVCSGNEAAASGSGQRQPGQGQDEKGGGGCQQDPHREEGGDGQHCQGGAPSPK